MGPTGDLTPNPGMCPDWESNLQPFGSQPMLNPLSYTSQGHVFKNFILSIHLTVQNDFGLNIKD